MPGPALERPSDRRFGLRGPAARRRVIYWGTFREHRTYAPVRDEPAAGEANGGLLQFSSIGLWLLREKSLAAGFPV